MPNREESYASAAILADVVGYRGGGQTYRLGVDDRDRALKAFEPEAFVRLCAGGRDFSKWADPQVGPLFSSIALLSSM